MAKEKIKVLTIAGFDPSGGAGILADIKTFESHRVYGMAVCTANTIQNEEEFVEVNWIDEKQVLDQLNILIKKHRFDYVKIGLIPSLDFLKKVIFQLNTQSSSPKIIWDTVLSASAGFDFKLELSELKNVLKEVFIITPNWEEAKQLAGKEDGMEAAKELIKYTNVYLKGGHNLTNKGKDYLFYKDKVYPFNPKKVIDGEKHGSGCVFSSALTANLAKGLPIIKACLISKGYINKFLSSSNTLLGKHKL